MVELALTTLKFSDMEFHSKLRAYSTVIFPVLALKQCADRAPQAVDT